jgi:hypothetical protein
MSATMASVSELHADRFSAAVTTAIRAEHDPEAPEPRA